MSRAASIAIAASVLSANLGLRRYIDYKNRPSSVAHYEPLRSTRYPSYGTPVQLARMPQFKRRSTRSRMGYGRSYSGARRTGRTRTVGYYGRFRRRPTGYLGEIVERKFHEIGLGDAVVTAAMTIHNLNLIPQGITEITRIGRKANISKLNIKGVIEIEAQTDAQSSMDTVRIMVVLDKQCNGATMTAVQLLLSDTMLSFNNLVNKGRFKVLHNEVHTITGHVALSTTFGPSQKYFEINKVFKKPIPIEFDGVTGAVTEIRSNCLYYLTQAFDGGDVKIEAEARVRFTD